MFFQAEAHRLVKSRILCSSGWAARRRSTRADPTQRFLCIFASFVATGRRDPPLGTTAGEGQATIASYTVKLSSHFHGAVASGRICGTKQRRYVEAHRECGEVVP
jgi:hypothetical protein